MANNFHIGKKCIKTSLIQINLIFLVFFVFGGKVGASNPNSENFCDVPGSVHIPSIDDEDSFMDFTIADSVVTDKSSRSKKSSKSKKTVRSLNSDVSRTSKSRRTSVVGAKSLEGKKKMRKIPNFTDL